MTIDTGHWLRVFASIVVAVAVGVLAWAGGLVAYEVSLRALYGQVPSAGDWRAVQFWSGIVFAVGLAPLGILGQVVRGWHEGRARLVLVPLVLGAAGVLGGTISVGAIFGGGGSWLSPETLLFGILFGTAGALFGLGTELAARFGERTGLDL